MDTLNTIHSLQQLFEADLKEQLHCETALSARIPHWLSEDSWHPLALLIREYIGVVATHTRILRGVGAADATEPSFDQDAAGVALLDGSEHMMGLCKYREVREACIVEALQTLMHLKIQPQQLCRLLRNTQPIHRPDPCGQELSSCSTSDCLP